MRNNCFIILLIIFSNIATAQDNNTLARIAYEDAETALSNGDYTTALDELGKVDNYLSRRTPKAQYLKVQAWDLAVRKNSNYTDAAINACKEYLDLSKSFDLPEDKVLEVTRILLQLNEKKKQVQQQETDAINEQKRKIEAEQTAKKMIPAVVKIIDDFVEELTTYKGGESVDEFAIKRKELSNLIRKSNRISETKYSLDGGGYPQVTSKRSIVFFDINWSDDNKKILGFKEYLEVVPSPGVVPSWQRHTAKLKEKLEQIKFFELKLSPTSSFSFNCTDMQGQLVTYMNVDDQLNPTNFRRLRIWRNAMWGVDYLVLEYSRDEASNTIY
jgi:hypothetical protein